MKIVFPEDIDYRCDLTNKTLEVDVEVSTADLIAELEKRRPCAKCVHGPNPIQCDELCTWGMKLADNFKEAK